MKTFSYSGDFDSKKDEARASDSKKDEILYSGDFDSKKDDNFAQG